MFVRILRHRSVCVRFSHCCVFVKEDSAPARATLPPDTRRRSLEECAACSEKDGQALLPILNRVARLRDVLKRAAIKPGGIRAQAHRHPAHL